MNTEFNLIINIAKELYYPFMFFVAIIGAYGLFKYGKSAISKQTNDANAQSNSILRSLIDDQRKEIDALKITVAHQTLQIEQLQGQVQTNAEIRLLVAEALKTYFTENPDKAKELIRKVKIA